MGLEVFLHHLDETESPALVPDTLPAKAGHSQGV